MIPKTAHFIWCNRTMPWLRYMTLQSFRNFHPGWKMKLYRPQGRAYEWHLLNNELGVEVIERPIPPEMNAWQPPNVSDWMRWDILSTSPGVYFDMDIVFVGPIHPEDLGPGVSIGHDAKPKDLEFLGADGVAVNYDTWFNNIALVASGKAPNEFFRSMTDLAIKNYKKNRPQSTGTSMLNQRFQGSWSTMKRAFPAVEFSRVPYGLVIPFGLDKIKDMFFGKPEMDDSNLRPVGLHWFGGDQIAKTMSRILHQGNYEKLDSVLSQSITHALSRKAPVTA